VRLHREIAGEPDAAVVRAFASGQRGSPRDRLGERQRHVVRLAGADEEANCCRPVLAREGGLEQCIGGLVATAPADSLVDRGRRGGCAHRFHDLGVGVAERGGGVGPVEHPAAILELDPHALGADDERLGSRRQ
jgi:hypothetical protein